jgi:RNA polymerase sigma factor (sigma-70 family)
MVGGEPKATQEGTDVASNLLDPVVQRLHRAVAAREAASMTDGQLLDCYLQTRDEGAFEALVRRHGPMVLGVCRRVLRDPNEADDAFQATFLVLVRKAASVTPRDRVANFLYGVAHQTAVRARSAAARRRRRERPAGELPETPARRADPPDDLREFLDRELSALPVKYRAAVVCCDLKGQTHQEAARRLGCPEGTLASRLCRGRRMLAARLTRRGVTASAGALAEILSGEASAGLPASLLRSTLQAARAGEVSFEVAALTKGVLRAMSLTKARMVAAVLFTAGVVALGGGLLSRPEAVADQPAGPKPEPKGEKARLEVHADGKGVEVRVAFAGELVVAAADRMSYDEQRKTLILEGNVRAQRRRGRWREDIRCRRLEIDRGGGTVRVEGGAGVGVNLPAPKKPEDEGEGAREFTLGEFYRRTGHVGAACFYYERVRRRHPGTPHAEKAKHRLADLRKGIGS